MTRYRYSRKQIVRWIKDREEYEPSWYPMDIILERLTEKVPGKSEARKPIEKIGPFTVTGIFGTEGLALAIEKVGDKVNEIIDYLNTNDRH